MSTSRTMTNRWRNPVILFATLMLFWLMLVNSLAPDTLLIGALVHLPQSKFPKVLETICRALEKHGFLLITMKQGNGMVTGPDGRQFYLWQDEDLRDVFQSQDLAVINFFRQSSKINPDEIWLGYLLKKS